MTTMTLPLPLRERAGVRGLTRGKRGYESYDAPTRVPLTRPAATLSHEGRGS
jgi:hypothetical protein